MKKEIAAGALDEVNVIRESCGLYRLVELRPPMTDDQFKCRIFASLVEKVSYVDSDSIGFRGQADAERVALAFGCSWQEPLLGGCASIITRPGIREYIHETDDARFTKGGK